MSAPSSERTTSPVDEENKLETAGDGQPKPFTHEEDQDIDLAFEDGSLHNTLSRISTQMHPDASKEVHEADPYKYYVDAETGCRLVVFLEDDPDDPRNMPVWRKWAITLALGILCFDVALGSAIVTGDMDSPQEYFHVSLEVVILTVTMFVIGFGVGPLVFAPVSEEIGRKMVYLPTMFLAMIFIIPCAVARNIGTLIVCRLICGTLFSAPMTLIGGSLGDIWKTSERGVAMSVFSAMPFLGPTIGVVVGAFIADFIKFKPTFRWIYWIFLIFSGAVYIVQVFAVPETHHATILRKRAKELRKLTGDHSYKVVKDVKPQSVGQIAKVTLQRPFQLLMEPIVAAVTVYMSVLYGLLYMFFFAFPVVFIETKGLSNHLQSLCFIPIAVGVLVAVCFSPMLNNDYNRRAQRYRDQGLPVPPEVRLIPMMVGCWFVPMGLFSFAWSSYAFVSIWGPCISSFGVGLGFIFLYNAANNYIVDSYQHYAASGLAAKTFVRSIWGACVPLFTVQMYHRLGNEWASSLLAFISLACCGIPYLFYFKGEQIRQYSKYAYKGE